MLFEHFMTALSVVYQIAGIMGSIAAVIGVIVTIKRK